MPHRSRLHRLAPTFLALGIVSCLTNGSQDTTDLVPLKVGNFWSYDILDPGGILVDSSYSEVVESIAVSSAGENFTAYGIAHRVNGVLSDEKNHHVNGPHGYYQVGPTEEDGEIGRHLYIKRDAAVGESWQALRLRLRDDVADRIDADTMRLTMVGRDVKFATPAGTFRCLVVKWPRRVGNDSLHIIWYFAPGVGPVAEIGIQPARDETDLADTLYTGKLRSYRAD